MEENQRVERKASFEGHKIIPYQSGCLSHPQLCLELLQTSEKCFP